MSTDVIADLGEIFLGSRLKRLAERMQSGAAKVVSAAGMAVQPTHMGLLAALDRAPMTVGQLVEAVGISQPGITRGVGQLVEMGLVEVIRGADLRERTARLTPEGVAAMAKIKRLVWPKLHLAVQDMCAGLSGSFLDQIAGLEAALAEKPLEVRAAGVPAAGLIVREYSADLAPLFHDINAEWISTMFRLEQSDREVLEDPRTHILDGGGAILFVEAPGLGIIGTCAIRRTGSGSAELTKMGVRESARGMKAGEFLLAATIARAKAMGIETLYLLTNSKCVQAIHLYEKLGFRHDAEIMATYGARYERCDVAMRYVPE
ncbi:MAG TPA: GNAT family N-acetyltransferase [Sphingomonas sp.]|uniref:bifunctional helix-turn-helix transcriptional regulator/GNAT family N-acetyltransferase n=1 Tax=Sphingomonas sp. TaxID=28214 RepID=UPI002C9D2373|nr:GNAT family N-acetyltransferase [Sphingomonas sp.]HMI19245.1 GNAT family N-acetyltransferase [Sphingomonas sp.]